MNKALYQLCHKYGESHDIFPTFEAAEAYAKKHPEDDFHSVNVYKFKDDRYEYSETRWLKK